MTQIGRGTSAARPDSRDTGSKWVSTGRKASVNGKQRTLYKCVSKPGEGLRIRKMPKGRDGATHATYIKPHNTVGGGVNQSVCGKCSNGIQRCTTTPSKESGRAQYTVKQQCGIRL
jgi:hypothetical protein